MKINAICLTYLYTIFKKVVENYSLFQNASKFVQRVNGRNFKTSIFD